MQVRGSLRKIVFSAFVIGSVGALAGCVVEGPGYRDDGYRDSRSYPPARPSNGYRYAYPGGLTLIFDSGLGLYSVWGYPDYYFYDGFFYRWQSGYWNRSRYWNNRWERCDSRRWPRPIYYVNNNYYVHGKRPHFDWDRDGRPDRRDGDNRRNDNDRERWENRPGDRNDRDRGRDGNPRRDDNDRERWENHDSRGDFRGQPHPGVPPATPGMRTGGDDDRAPGMREGVGLRTPPRDDGDDEARAREQRRLDALRNDEQRGAREQELMRDRARQARPDDALRHPDDDRGLARRQADDAARDQRRAAEQAARDQQRGAEQAAREQQQGAQQAAREQQRGAEQAARARERGAEQAARAQRQRDDDRGRDDQARDDGRGTNRSDDGGSQDDRGSERWNDWRNRR